MFNQAICFTLGVLLLVVGVFELIPAWVDFIDGRENYQVFIWCSFVSIFFGGAFVLANYREDFTLDIRQTFMLTTLSWFIVSLFSSLPFYFSDYLHVSFTDAFFESISGVTTTGSTVFSGLDYMPRGILLWRSIIQWIGGIGIIAFAIVVLPFLRVGGMQLFHTESSDRSEKAMPKTLDLIRSLLIVYFILTVSCFVVYFMLGMTFFDAVNHALTTIPTGGYSTHDASFGYYDSASLQYAASFFMLAGGIPFILYVQFLFRGQVNFWQDEQFRYFIFILLALIGVMSIWLSLNSEYGFFESLRYSVFNIISVITTTGYAINDYMAWGSFASMFFFMITFLGACAGSTSGGIKVMRLIILARTMNRQIKTLIYPRGCFLTRYQGRPVDSDLAITVMSFLGVFVLSNVLLSVALMFVGLDFDTAVSGAATALANVGPGVGEVIGPAGNFASLPDSAKWLLSLGMFLGRLEVMTILVLFRPEYWRF